MSKVVVFSDLTYRLLIQTRFITCGLLTLCAYWDLTL